MFWLQCLFLDPDPAGISSRLALADFLSRCGIGVVVTQTSQKCNPHACWCRLKRGIAISIFRVMGAILLPNVIRNLIGAVSASCSDFKDRPAVLAVSG